MYLKWSLMVRGWTGSELFWPKFWISLDSVVGEKRIWSGNCLWDWSQKIILVWAPRQKCWIRGWKHCQTGTPWYVSALESFCSFITAVPLMPRRHGVWLRECFNYFPRGMHNDWKRLQKRTTMQNLLTVWSCRKTGNNVFTHTTCIQQSSKQEGQGSSVLWCLETFEIGNGFPDLTLHQED